MSREIRENYRGLDSTSRVLVDELVRKLDFLLSFYLRMRYSVSRYERYFATTDVERIQERISMLRHEAETGPERIRQIKARTKVVLEKRLDRYQKAVENKQLVEAQTETVQEVLQLLRDQSYSMRDPRSITEQLDGLVNSAEETERGVREMEELLSSDQEMLIGGVMATSDLTAGLDLEEPPSPTPARPARVTATPPVPPPPPPPPRKRIVQY
jgi:hypothetical protein